MESAYTMITLALCSVVDTALLKCYYLEKGFLFEGYVIKIARVDSGGVCRI